MAPTASWTQPVSGFGFARDICLATLASGVSALVTPLSGSAMVTASYQPGDIFIFNGLSLNPTFISPASDPTPAPNIFGSWVFFLLGGQLPTVQSTGGMDFLGGAFGSINWTTTAFTGTEAIQIQTQSGGIIGFDSAIPSLTYQVVGTEIFTMQFQVVDNIPSEVIIQLYGAVGHTWYGAYLGTENTGLTLTNKGSISPVIGQWQSISFSAQDLRIPAGELITGIAWGVWNSSTISTVIFSDTYTTLTTPIVGVIPSGYVDCDQNGGLGYFALSHGGPLVNVSVLGAPPANVILPSFIYTGLIFNQKRGIPYFISFDGTIHNYASGVVNTVTAPPSGVAIPARWMYTDGVDNLYTMFSNSNDVATYNIVSSGWTVTGSPFNATLDTVAFSSGIGMILAGGSNFQAVSVTGGIVDMAYSALSSQVLVADLSPQISVYNVTQGALTFAQSISGFTGVPVHMATEPAGSQALVTDSTNNKVYVLTDTGGVWSQTSTVALTGPTALTTLVSGVTQALVCQPTNNTVSVLNKSVNVWSVAQTLSVSNPISVAVASSGTTLTGVVATPSGVTFLNYNGAVWTVDSAITISPVPSLVAVDQVSTVVNGLSYSAATSGSNIVISIIQNKAVVASYTINNDTLGVLSVVDWEVVVPAANGDFNVGYFIAGNTANTTIPSFSPTNPVRALWLPTVVDYVPILLVAGPHTIWSFYNDKPQSYTRITDSLVAYLSGASWITIDLNNRNKVSSITTDVSGNIFAVATDDELYKWNLAGVLASGYPFTITPPLNQEFGVPLGFSKLVYSLGKIYSASSLAGGIVTIIP